MALTGKRGKEKSRVKNERLRVPITGTKLARYRIGFFSCGGKLRVRKKRRKTQSNSRPITKSQHLPNVSECKEGGEISWATRHTRS